jgi:hypothetical protein
LFSLAFVSCLSTPLYAGEKGSHGLPLVGDEAEEFLRVARVVNLEEVPEGITKPDRATLTDGQRTLHALWKTIDKHVPGQHRFEDGGWEFDFRDSWKSEVAAYELDKLLGLDLVPPTVERRIEGRVGSLQLWVEETVTPDIWKEEGQRPSSPVANIRFNNQMHKVRFFHQLTYNADFHNVHNVLIDPALRIYVIDNSRAFRIQEELLAPNDLVCFSRTCLEKLKALNRALLKERLGKWLGDMQIDGLLARRDKILLLVEERIAEKGEGGVLFY